MKRLLVSLCCMIVICLSCISATAEKLVYNDFEYELMEDGSAILELYIGKDGTDVYIPYELDGHPIMGANDNPFWQTKITSVTVPEDHPYLVVINGVLYGKSDRKVIYYPPDAPHGVFVMPSWVVNFGPHCLYGCKNVTGIEKK